jgi:cAMP-dependent protein kinase regulator
MSQAFMFSALDPAEQTVVIDAMEEKQISAGTKVIVQGDDGDCMYLIDSGQLDCYRRATKDGDDKKIKAYQPGEAFGELALLYNAPRAATIIAVTEVVLFTLDRETFNHIVKDSAAKKRERYEQFLSKVDILQDMEPYERLQIADALKSYKFQKGETIVREGDVGDTFFILEEGEAVATKVLKCIYVFLKTYKFL